jgi:hypothetical protein
MTEHFLAARQCFNNIKEASKVQSFLLTKSLPEAMQKNDKNREILIMKDLQKLCEYISKTSTTGQALFSNPKDDDFNELIPNTETVEVVESTPTKHDTRDENRFDRLLAKLLSPARETIATEVIENEADIINSVEGTSTHVIMLSKISKDLDSCNMNIGANNQMLSPVHFHTEPDTQLSQGLRSPSGSCPPISPTRNVPKGHNAQATMQSTGIAFLKSPSRLPGSMMISPHSKYVDTSHEIYSAMPVTSPPGSPPPPPPPPKSPTTGESLFDGSINFDGHNDCLPPSVFMAGAFVNFSNNDSNREAHYISHAQPLKAFPLSMLKH